MWNKEPDLLHRPKCIHNTSEKHSVFKAHLPTNLLKSLLSMQETLKMKIYLIFFLSCDSYVGIPLLAVKRGFLLTALFSFY